MLIKHNLLNFIFLYPNHELHDIIEENRNKNVFLSSNFYRFMYKSLKRLTQNSSYISRTLSVYKSYSLGTETTSVEFLSMPHLYSKQVSQNITHRFHHQPFSTRWQKDRMKLIKSIMKILAKLFFKLATEIKVFYIDLQFGCVQLDAVFRIIKCKKRKKMFTEPYKCFE